MDNTFKKYATKARQTNDQNDGVLTDFLHEIRTNEDMSGIIILQERIDKLINGDDRLDRIIGHAALAHMLELFFKLTEREDD